MKAKLLKLIRYNFVGAICLLLPITALAADENRGQLNSSDYKFMRGAAEGGIAEVQLGQIAKERASDPAVKNFADRMIGDHGQANQQLTQLATQKGATLPAEISSSERRETDRLTKLSGPEFDRAYMKCMVRMHKADMKEFEREAKDGNDPEVQAWSAKTLSTLQAHLRLAEDVDANLK
jgi:putative membrane protein